MLALISGVAVAGLDLAIALCPNLEANGIFHAVYLLVQSLVVKKEE